jgi:hypothetical protein
LLEACAAVGVTIAVVGVATTTVGKWFPTQLPSRRFMLFLLASSCTVHCFEQHTTTCFVDESHRAWVDWNLY